MTLEKENKLKEDVIKSESSKSEKVIKSEKNTNPKNKSNIATYAVVMIICVIIIILIAAMADNREEEIGNRVMETEQTNASFENELVNLREENYKLKKEQEKNVSKMEEETKYKAVLEVMSNIWTKINMGDTEGAKQDIISLDSSSFDDIQRGYYEALCKILSIDSTTKQPITENNAQ